MEEAEGMKIVYFGTDVVFVTLQNVMRSWLCIPTTMTRIILRNTRS